MVIVIIKLFKLNYNQYKMLRVLVSDGQMTLYISALHKIIIRLKIPIQQN